MIRRGDIRPLSILLVGLLACGGDPSGPTAGSLAVSVSGLPTGAAAAIAVSGPGGFLRTLAGSETLSGLTSGNYTVAATSVSASGNSYTPSPSSQAVAVNAGDTPATAAVTYEIADGNLAVAIAGLPDSAAAAVQVTGPGGYDQAVTASTTLTALAPGSYTVTASSVSSGGTQYSASPPTQSVSVAGGATDTASVSYTSATPGALDLQISGMYLTQSVQTYTGTVPLVKDRNGYLRVFVTANTSNTAAPIVRVRFYLGGVLTDTKLINPPGLSVPQTPDQSTLAKSWNVAVPGLLIQPTLSILADVDPANAVAEADESDNNFPVSGTPQPMDVRTTSTFNVSLVPIKQSANDLQGDVTDANKAQFLAATMQIHPLAAYDANVHAVYVHNGTAAGANDATSWTTILSEIDALRASEGNGRYYYGVLKVGYSSGLAGIGYIGGQSAVGWDYLPSGGQVAAHEWGHNWGRPHSPCGGASNPDPNYPYAGGTIGVYGFDVAGVQVEPPTDSDIMGYCSNKWISDWTYVRVLNYRLANPVFAGTAGQAVQPCLLVWGRIEHGQPVLEPAFQVITRPSLPQSTGPYSVEGRATDGTRLFALDFQAQQVADVDGAAEHFAFAVPLSDSRATRLATLRLRARGREAVMERRQGAAPGPQFAIRREAPGRVALLWDAAAHPMVMVRDPATGQVLSFARGGRVELPAIAPSLELVASDRVQSRAFRMVVPAR